MDDIIPVNVIIKRACQKEKFKKLVKKKAHIGVVKTHVSKNLII